MYIYELNGVEPKVYRKTITPLSQVSKQIHDELAAFVFSKVILLEPSYNKSALRTINAWRNIQLAYPKFLAQVEFAKDERPFLEVDKWHFDYFLQDVLAATLARGQVERDDVTSSPTGEITLRLKRVSFEGYEDRHPKVTSGVPKRLERDLRDYLENLGP